jgi:hypothetical protein
MMTKLMKSFQQLGNLDIQWGGNEVTRAELITECFAGLNNFKRHRTLIETKQNTADKQYHELQMFKMIDKIELALRAINREERESGE